MKNTLFALLGVSWTFPLCLCAAALPSAAHADTDACTMLTQAEVASAVGVPVAAGAHVTPTYVRTCTWNAAAGGSAIKAVTVFLESAADYDSGKQQITAARAAAGANGTSIQSVRVGDDAYYFVAGTQVGLLAKKGSVAFKVAVYATLPVDKKEAMELTLAKAVLTKL
jgi:hypothetical protein